MTLFERIINREIPATIEFEDADVIVIRDIAPVAPLHLLIIPKKPIPNVDALTEDDQYVVGKVFLVAQKLARQFGVAEGGYRVVTNVNANAGQTVFHLHFHLLAGGPLGAMVGQDVATIRNEGTPDTSNGATLTATMTDRSTMITPTMSWRPLVREGAIVILAAIGLAIGFNQMNPRRIPWLKPEIQRMAASDEELGLAKLDSSSIEQESKPVQPSDSASLLKSGRPASVRSEQPISDSGVESQGELKEPTLTKPTFIAKPGVILEITLQQFKALRNAEHFLIDARTAESFAKGHIGNAVNVYGGEVESRIPQLLNMVPQDRPILIYCDGGECELSHHVANALAQFGYGPMYIYTGGWAEWSKQQ